MKMLSVLVLVLLCGTLQAAENESFLDPSELAKLTPHPDVPGASRYITPGVDIEKYSKIIVGNVGFYYAPDSKSKEIDADAMKKVSDAMKAALVQAAANKREVVLTKGPGAALINIAVTDLILQNKKRGLLGYTPIGLVVTTTGNLAGMRIQLKNAKIEGEVVDSVTGEVLSIFRVDSIGNWDDKKGMSWDDLRETFQDSVSKALTALGPVQE